MVGDEAGRTHMNRALEARLMGLEFILGVIGSH